VGIPRAEITVASADVTGVEFVIPPQKEISGRIILEGRGALPRLSLPLISTSAANGFPSQTGTITINPQPDGTFKVTVPLEERQVGRPNGLPVGYALKSLRYGSTDLASALLKVTATDTAELSVTLTTPDLPPVKVSGKVSGLDTAAFARGPVTLTLNEPRFLTSLQAPLSRDGTFEFASVFPGNYSVAVSNVTGTNIPPIVVATRDLTGLEISVPRQKEVIGRIVLEGSGPMPRLAVPMNIVGFSTGGGTGPTLFMNINPQPDGTFRVTLQEGERRIGQITGLPQGYSVKAMTYGNVDVLSTPMKVAPGDTAELRVTVSTPTTPPVKVSGKVTGLDTAMLSRGPVSVSMSASGYASTFQTTVAADGSFQFAEVFPGSYSARVTGAGIAPNQATTIVVSNADVRNVEMAVTRQREISGRVVLEGPGPMPRFSLPLNNLSSALFLGSIGISPQQDGTFRFNVPEGEHRPGPINGLPPGYAVKAMTYGTVDLLSAPMKVTPGDTTELRITISTPTTSPVKVSGKVSGLDATMLARGSLTVALLTPTYVRTFQASVASDGSFEFPEVFPGNYTARVTGPGIAPHQPIAIAVSTTDVRNVEIALPGQREITGRVVVEGSAPIPRFSFRLPQAPAASAIVAQVLSIAPATNGSFRLSLPEGERPLGDVIGLPPGYTLKAATYGTVDLMHESLKVARTDTGELVFTVSASLKPVSVSGRVDGLDAAVLTQGIARVIMASPAYAGNLSTAVRPDGSFEFLSVFPGSYVAQVSSPTLTAPPPAGIPAGLPLAAVIATNIAPAASTGVPVTVSDSDIRNLNLSSPRQYPISGRVEILGGGPIPRLGLTFASQGAGIPATITTTTLTTQPDGTFRFTLPEGERRVGVGQIPPGYALKSITYGTIDLQQTSLKVGANQTSSELRVTLEKLQPAPWVSVSGKVVGLPAEVRNVRVALTGMFTSPQNIPLNPDGTFAFDQVFQGPNSVRLLGNIGETLQPPLNITVGPKDMTDVEILYRR